MDESASEQTAQVVGLVKAVLGRDVVGVYLYGSAVLGGLRPASDLEIFVSSSFRDGPPEEKRRLFELLSPISGRRTRPASWRPLELTVVVEHDVRPWRCPPRIDFQYGEWLRDDRGPRRAGDPSAGLAGALIQRGIRPHPGGASGYTGRRHGIKRHRSTGSRVP